jgi:hypothetical protein
MKRNNSSLDRLARLAQTHPQLLAGPLALYQEQEGLSNQQLAHRLGCDAEGLFRLALCERPRQAAPSFREDIQRIADYIHADMLQLAMLIRAVEARETIRQTPVAVRPTLLAARDHDDVETSLAKNGDLPSDGK